jgi:ribonucleoside-diphosphate reductase alpha chain
VTAPPAPLTADATAAVRVVRRDGSLSAFDPSEISVAMTKAFLAVGGTDTAVSSRLHHVVEQLTSSRCSPTCTSGRTCPASSP